MISSRRSKRLPPVRCSTVSTITLGGAERFCNTIRLVAGTWSPLVSLQCRRRIGRIAEAGERRGIDYGLGPAIAALRVHWVCGVAQQGHASEHPTVERIAIDHGIGKDHVRIADHGGGIERVEGPVLIGRVEIFEPPGLLQSTGAATSRSISATQLISCVPSASSPSRMG